MPDPQQHAESRGWIESIGRWIPGFSGYLEREYRRESDQLARTWMADRLEQAKPGLNSYVKKLTEAGKLAELTPCQSFATQVDTLVGKLRTAPAGYSGFFDFVKIDEEQLEEVYNLDVGLFKSVDGLGQSIEALASSDDSPSLTLPPLEAELASISKVFSQREKVLKGIAD